MKIAIVGADEKKWTSKFMAIVARQVIEKILTHDPETILISGHCPKGGIDILAEEIADRLNIPKEIYPPKVNRWEGGYKSRNIQIAKACDKLACIEPFRVSHSGGMWTMNYANKLGKPTKLIIIKELLEDWDKKRRSS